MNSIEKWNEKHKSLLGRWRFKHFLTVTFASFDILRSQRRNKFQGSFLTNPRWSTYFFEAHSTFSALYSHYILVLQSPITEVNEITLAESRIFSNQTCARNYFFKVSKIALKSLISPSYTNQPFQIRRYELWSI